MQYLRQFILLLAVVFVIIVTFFCVYFVYVPIIAHHDLYYILKPNTTARQLTDDLHQRANLRYPILFRWLIKIRGDDEQLKSGEYLFPCGGTSLQVLAQIVQGKVVQHAFTIINGWNFAQTFDSLNKASVVKHTLKNKSFAAIAKAMQLRHKIPEGLLFPETYYYTLGTTDLQLLNRAYKKMYQYLQQEWPQRDKNLPYKTQYTTLIIASMVEKEASIKQEKPIVAAIILKRLQKWMHLQIDATVIYGLGEKFKGDLTYKDLRSKTPYNTYVHYGLPPTPIAMPGPDSIYAALHPAKTDMLYFVAKKDGSHVFSKTLEQHTKNVAKYQLQ